MEIIEMKLFNDIVFNARKQSLEVEYPPVKDINPTLYLSHKYKTDLFQHLDIQPKQTRLFINSAIKKAPLKRLL